MINEGLQANRDLLEVITAIETVITKKATDYINSEVNLGANNKAMPLIEKNIRFRKSQISNTKNTVINNQTKRDNISTNGNRYRITSQKNEAKQRVQLTKQ